MGTKASAQLVMYDHSNCMDLDSVLKKAASVCHQGALDSKIVHP